MAGRILPLCHASAATLAAIHGACFSPGWREVDFQYLLQDPLYAGFILKEKNDKILGFIDWYRVGDTGDIYSLCVLPSYRGHGLGRQLLSALVKAVSQQGDACTLFLEVAEGNVIGQHLYISHGFHLIGQRRCYYSSNNSRGTTALVFSRPFCEKERIFQ
ncbi:MAG: GNAT family N-acetyltransferase [Holosporales bacterium]|jgi:ribosomal-protein-alanine N-acetyltransferase|nr:GNAT family N-acetyltransferase [Holosporales bacterium]